MDINYDLETSGGRNVNMAPWTVRRRIIFTTLILCAAAIFYIMMWGQDTRVNEAIILGSFSLSGAVIGSYIFGSVWQDNTSKNITMTNQRGGVTIAPNATIIDTDNESPDERKERAKARLARMRAKSVAVDNPDG